MLVAILVALLALAIVPAEAEDRVTAIGPNWTASLGANLWLSSGESRWEHEVPPSVLLGHGELGSRLTFKDTDSMIVSLDGDVVLWRRLVIAVTGGWGGINDGELIDEDFQNGVNFLRTRSTIDDGKVYFGNVNVGVRILDLPDFEGRRFFVDLLAGYQWWRERYEAFGLSNDIPGLGSVGISSGTKVIEETWTWQSLRIGGRAYVPLVQRLGLRVNAFFLPWNSVKIQDDHPLRSDLEQDPSIVLDGSGGFGWQVEGGLTYTIWRGFGLEAGYRAWSVKIHDGDAKFRVVGASGPKQELKEAKTQRGGMFFGMYYRF